MPRFLIPRRSGAHRVAGIALYRALLTQCRALQISQQQRDEAQNLIRTRFRQTQHLHSSRRLEVSFEAGYEAIDHLDAAVVGDEVSKSYLLSLLSRAPERAKRPLETSIPLPVDQPTLSNLEVARSKDEKPRLSILDRSLPLTQLSGRRHVPRLINANHIPMLRIKKPQPESLSRYIRQRLAQRQKGFDRRTRLEHEMEIARREDEWDRLINDHTTQSLKREISSHPDEIPWTGAVATSLSQFGERYRAERRKNQIMAEKMQAAVDREQALYDKEKSDREEARRLRFAHSKDCGLDRSTLGSQ